MTCPQWLQIWPWEDVTCDCPWVLWTQLSQFGTVEISAANWGKSKLLWSAFWTWPWACQLALRCGEKNFRNGSHVCRPCISKSTVGEKKKELLAAGVSTNGNFATGPVAPVWKESVKAKCQAESEGWNRSEQMWQVLKCQVMRHEMHRLRNLTSTGNVNLQTT